jgi:hypothetical protein
VTYDVVSKRLEEAAVILFESGLIIICGILIFLSCCRRQINRSSDCLCRCGERAALAASLAELISYWRAEHGGGNPPNSSEVRPVVLLITSTVGMQGSGGELGSGGVTTTTGRKVSRA